MGHDQGFGTANLMVRGRLIKNVKINEDFCGYNRINITFLRG